MKRVFLLVWCTLFAQLSWIYCENIEDIKYTKDPTKKYLVKHELPDSVPFDSFGLDQEQLFNHLAKSNILLNEKQGLLPTSGQVNAWIQNQIKPHLYDLTIISKSTSTALTNILTEKYPRRTYTPLDVPKQTFPAYHIEFKFDNEKMTVNTYRYNNVKLEIGALNGKLNHLKTVDSKAPPDKQKETPNKIFHSSWTYKKNILKKYVELATPILEKARENIIEKDKESKVLVFEITPIFQTALYNVFKDTIYGTCLSSGRRKRATTTEPFCAIHTNKNGQVTSINAANFLKIINDKEVGTKDKNSLVKLVKHNLDKVTADAENSKMNLKKIKNIQKLDNIKDHVNKLDLVNIDSIKIRKTKSEADNIKLSPTQAAKKLNRLVNSNYTKDFITGVDLILQSRRAVGLIKTFVNGINNNDTDTLVQVGLSLLSPGGPPLQIAQLLASGKTAQNIGRIAGPIGGTLQSIGSNTWSIIKSVRRLKNGDRYEKSDAIADIVYASIDTAMTVTMTAFSIAFPPAAPLIFAVGTVVNIISQGIIGVFKGINEVNRINAIISLHDFEKSNIFFSNLFGTQADGYIKDLVEEKKANNMAVEDYQKYINSASIRGVVFPSRTSATECHVSDIREVCYGENWHIIHGNRVPSYWENCSEINKNYGSNCELNGPCNGSFCTDSTSEPRAADGVWVKKVTTKCLCKSGSGGPSGFARKNSYVDFQNPQEVYLDRAAPDNNNRKFKCRPASISRKDMLSETSSSTEYYCNNAIGLLDSNGNGKGMIFNLEDGDDSVYLSKHSLEDNLFYLGNEGIKEFSGSGGKNEFVLNGDCRQSLSGDLYGGGSERDVISISDQCHKSLDISVNFITGKVKTLKDSSVNLNIKDIENVHGRENANERVVVSCTTKDVVLRGGLMYETDEIIVPSARCVERDLRIKAEGSTRIILEEDVDIAKKNSIYVAATSTLFIPLRLQFEIKSTLISGLTINLYVTHKYWKVAEVSKNANLNSLDVKISGKSTEFFQFRLPVSSNGVNVALPNIRMYKEIEDDHPGHLIFDMNTKMLKVIYSLNIPCNPSKSCKIVGFHSIPSIILINTSAPWNIFGGDENDVFSTPFFTQAIDGEGGENALILENHPSSNGKTIFVNLVKQEMGTLNSNLKGQVTNIHHVTGRQFQPDILYPSCTTKFLEGGGGLGKGAEDEIVILDNLCSGTGLPNINFKLDDYSKVNNSATKGSFTYHVKNLLTTDFKLIVGKENKHFIKINSNVLTLIESIKFQTNHSTLELKLNSGQVHSFPMFRHNESSEFTNPILGFYQTNGSVSSSLSIEADGTITSTYLIQHEEPSEPVLGIPVKLNRFLINITAYTPSASKGIIKGSEKTERNDFWVFNLNNPLETLEGGNCTESEICLNTLQFGNEFQTGKPVEVTLSLETGRLSVLGNDIIKNLKHIQVVQGRKLDYEFDKIYVTCETISVAEFEEVIVQSIPTNSDCYYDLKIEVGQHTRVVFEEPKNFEGTIHYKLLTPRSFSVERRGSSKLGATHNFFLPFKLNDLAKLQFNVYHERLFYVISGKEYELDMISSNKQFYTQPVLITQDAFLIQVGLDGSILLSSVGNGTFQPLNVLQNEVIPRFETIAKRLGVSVILQTYKDLLYFGHRNIDRDQNVLENVETSVSHLIGGGADNTIYDILSLSRDVYIYPGFENQENLSNSNIPKQTIDLTDIVVPIRLKSKRKYLPLISQNGSHSIISMDGYEDEYPGKVIIYNGASAKVRNRLQFILNSVIMDIVPVYVNVTHRRKKRSLEEFMEKDKSVEEFEFRPRPLEIPKGYVYSISPEDLEDNQSIQVGEDYNVTENSSKFTLFLNGSSFYMTNLLENEENQEATTLILSEFYKVTSSDNDDEFRLLSLPGNLSGITVSLPGLNIFFNDSKITIVEGFPSDAKAETAKEITKEDLIEWRFALYEAEELLLSDMPEISRVFVCDDCGLNKLFLFFEIITGIILILMGICIWKKLRQRNMRKYSCEKAKSVKFVSLGEKVILQKYTCLGCEQE